MATQVFSQEEITDAQALLEGKSPQEILRWAVERFHPRLTMATAFGAEGCCIIHMLAEIEPRVRVFNLDTGYQFAETLQMRDRIRDRYGMDVDLVKPEMSVADYEQEHGGPLYVIRSDQCCHDRKIVPLRRTLAGYDAWISSIRKDQTEHRARAGFVQWDRKFELAKVNPLLSWTKKEVWNFVYKHNVPYNPLHDQNYQSIGCQPCTRPVGAHEDERAGRWSGSVKKECGLHVVEVEGGGGI